MEVIGVLGSQDVDRNGSFSSELLQCQDPQLLIVADASGAPAMLYRGMPNAKGGVEISAASTALALVTMQTALASCKGADFDDLCARIRSLESYAEFERVVTKSMKDGRSVIDTNNTAVILALKAVSDDVFRSLMASSSKNTVNGVTLDPIDFFIDSTTTTLRSMSINPTYTGFVTSPSGDSTMLRVAGRSDYSLWDLINNRTVYGPSVTYELSDDGTYVYDFDWKNTYGYTELGTNVLCEVLDIFGLGSFVSDEDIKLALEWMVPIIEDFVIYADDIINNELDGPWWEHIPMQTFKKLLGTVADKTVEFLINKVKSIPEAFLDNAKGVFGVISKAEGIANLSLRVGFAIFSPTPITWSVVKSPNNPVGDGLFSVAEGHQVRFASGSLEYDGTNGYSFAAHQYDYGGYFGWGTGSNPTNTSTDPYAYSSFDDWGNHIAGGWRTLTLDEWCYVIFYRPNASAKRGAATVCGVHGMVLLPDNFSGGTFHAASNWSTNVYDASSWSDMEAAGAVFLPAAGYRYRYGTELSDVGTRGFYWSSTPYLEIYAYCIGFNEYRVGSYGGSSIDRFSGRSVRLVQDY